MPPASEDSIRALKNNCEWDLPADYLSFLRLSNGGDGELGIDPGWFQIWPAEEVLPLNEGYEIHTNIPGFFGFGSNGAGELLAFETRAPHSGAVYMIPFVAMEESDAIKIADDFLTFAHAFGSLE